MERLNRRRIMLAVVGSTAAEFALIGACVPDSNPVPVSERKPLDFFGYEVKMKDYSSSKGLLLVCAAAAGIPSIAIMVTEFRKAVKYFRDSFN